MQSRLYVDSVADPMSFPARVAAKMNNHGLIVLPADVESKKANIMGDYPFLMSHLGNVGDSVAIAKYVAHGHPTLLGASNEERAKVDQWIYWSMTGHVMSQKKAIGAILGTMEVLQKDYNESMQAVKANAKVLDGVLKGKDWLVGNSCTLADITLACHFMTAQQTILDAGFRKAMPGYSAWFERVVALPEFVAVCGNVKSAAKTIKPQIKAEEKKVEAKKPAAAPKPKADDGDEPQKEKSPKNPLDALPPTNFDLFNFKTFFVNEPDRYGAGIDELKKQFDKEGWSIWFLHYEMFGDEGKKLYHTENLADGFLQRFDSFRKYSFGRMCILGTEEKQEIMGVFLWRSLDITQECKDHPQFEYYMRRKLDIFGNADDEKLMREFWGSNDGSKANGLECLSCKWHK